MPIIEKTDVIEDHKENEVVRVAHFVAQEHSPAHEVKEICKSYYPTKVRMLDIDEDQIRDDLARISVMTMSYVAQSARGLGRPMVPQSEIDKAKTIVERFMIRWKGEPDPAHTKAVDAYFVSAALMTETTAAGPARVGAACVHTS